MGTIYVLSNIHASLATSTKTLLLITFHRKLAFMKPPNKVLKCISKFSADLFNASGSCKRNKHPATLVNNKHHLATNYPHGSVVEHLAKFTPYCVQYISQHEHLICNVNPIQRSEDSAQRRLRFPTENLVHAPPELNYRLRWGQVQRDLGGRGW